MNITVWVRIERMRYDPQGMREETEEARMFPNLFVVFVSEQNAIATNYPAVEVGSGRVGSRLRSASEILAYSCVPHVYPPALRPRLPANRIRVETAMTRYEATRQIWTICNSSSTF